MPVFLGALRRTVSSFRQFHIQWAVTKRHKHSKKHAVNAVEQQKAEGCVTGTRLHRVCKEFWSSPLWANSKHKLRIVGIVFCSRFYTLASPHSVEVEVKKSRFLATAWPVSSPEEVGRWTVKCSFVLPLPMQLHGIGEGYCFGVCMRSSRVAGQL